MGASRDVSLFEEKKPLATSAVWACAVYSLVPFVGVVFVPFVLVFGLVAVSRGDPVDRRALAAGVLILIVQLILWWLMYAVPKWNTVL